MKTKTLYFLITNIRWFHDGTNDVINNNEAHDNLGTPKEILIEVNVPSGKVDIDKEISDLIRENYSYQAISFDKKQLSKSKYEKMQVIFAFDISNDCCVHQVTPTRAILD